MDALLAAKAPASSRNKDTRAARSQAQGSAVMQPTLVRMFAEEYVSGVAIGSMHAMVLATRYPPGAQYGPGEEAGEEEEEQIEAIAKTCQEATFWAAGFGYPVILAPSERVYRKWEGGERGTEIDAGIRRCFTELQLRTEFQLLFAEEEERLRTAVTKAPRLMLAKMESEEMEMTAEEIRKRDEQTRKEREELELERAEEVAKNKKRQQQMEEVQRRLALTTAAEEKE